MKNIKKLFKRRQVLIGATALTSAALLAGCKEKVDGGTPDNPKKSFDVYIDKNPKDTIKIKYKSLADVKCCNEKKHKIISIFSVISSRSFMKFTPFTKS